MTDMTTNPTLPTRRQRSLAITLLTERHGMAEDTATTTVDARFNHIDRRSFSVWIDTLMADATVNAVSTTVRRNRYDGNCADCGANVPAGDGSLTNDNGSWVVRHVGGCPEVAPAAPAAEAYTAEANEFHQIGDDIFRTVANRTRTRIYAQRARVAFDGRIHWMYAGGVVNTLTADTRMTAEQAAAFGHRTGRCVFCARTIRTNESLAVGYGPVCADRHGLPWGDVTAEQRADRTTTATATPADDHAEECDRCGDEFISATEARIHDCALVPA